MSHGAAKSAGEMCDPYFRIRTCRRVRSSYISLGVSFERGAHNPNHTLNSLIAYIAQSQRSIIARLPCARRKSGLPIGSGETSIDEELYTRSARLLFRKLGQSKKSRQVSPGTELSERERPCRYALGVTSPEANAKPAIWLPIAVDRLMG